MSSTPRSIQEFLACRRIAVAGVSREGNLPANHIYRRLQQTGAQVFPLNPKASTVEGAPCYPDLRSIPGGVDAVMIATPSSASLGIVEQCRDLGIARVWMHRGIGAGSVSAEAVRACRDHGIDVIDGACPLMFCAPVDPFHRVFRILLGLFGRLPHGASRGS